MEQECVSDIIELLLEHPHLFTLSEEVALSTINTQLKVSHILCILSALGCLLCTG